MAEETSNVTPLRRLTSKAVMDLAMDHAEAETQEQRLETLNLVARRLVALGLMEDTGPGRNRITPAGWQALEALMAFAHGDRHAFSAEGLTPSPDEWWDSVFEWLKIRKHFDAVATEAIIGAHERTQQ